MTFLAVLRSWRVRLALAQALLLVPQAASAYTLFKEIQSGKMFLDTGDLRRMQGMPAIGITLGNELKLLLVDDQGRLVLGQSAETIGKVDQGLGGASAWLTSRNWNLGSLTDSVDVPGVATSALQLVGNASLAQIDTDLDVALSTRASEATLATRASEATLSTLNGKVANNYGVATGAVRTAAQVGNASGAADFSAGNYSAQTQRVVVATNQPTLPTEEQAHTKNVVAFNASFANAGSININGNGSLVAPINYTVTPGSSETWYVYELSVFFQATGTPDTAEFGTGSILTNGVQFIVTVGGVEYVMTNITSNLGIVRVFPDSPFNLTGSSFLNSIDFYQGVWRFPKPIRLRNSTSDLMTIRVRDNLSGGILDFFRVSAQYWREVP